MLYYIRCAWICIMYMGMNVRAPVWRIYHLWMESFWRHRNNLGERQSSIHTHISFAYSKDTNKHFSRHEELSYFSESIVSRKNDKWLCFFNCLDNSIMINFSCDWVVEIKNLKKHFLALNVKYCWIGNDAWNMHSATLYWISF